MTKKHLLWGLLLILALVGCPTDANNSSSGDNDGGNSGVSPTKKIYLIDKPEGDIYNIWAWKENGNADINYDTKSWPGGTFQIDKHDDIGEFTYFTVDYSYPLGLLFVHESGSPQTPDVVIPIDVLKAHDTFFFAYANPKEYYTNYNDAVGLIGASIVKANEIAISVSRLNEINLEDLTVTDCNDNPLTVASATIEKIILTDGSIQAAPYYITYQGKKIKAILTGDAIDDGFACEDETLGITINGSNVTFKMWAPLASEVTLLLYTSSSTLTTPAKEVAMTRGNKGVYSVTQDCSGYKYYKYRIKNPEGTYEVSDIWGFAASADSVASQITDIKTDSTSIPTGTLNDTEWGTQSGYYNPFGNSGTEKKWYREAIIYEMHIRDWSKAVSSSNKGKFLEFIDDTIINHLTELGITHVQILPMFDYAQTNDDPNYNWGYNPYHYNVPEGRYVTEGYTDGTQAVKEMRQMIAKLHEAGIAVNMDVVYNHTSGIRANSLYDMTVPGYFYRFDDSGNYTNGSGCGNETATNHVMFKKYVIESLRHWMLDYHINGFRFDLMGCHERSTMAAIYDALYEIDQNVMVYGEPWAGGGTSIDPAESFDKGAIKQATSSAHAEDNGVGCFDDGYRDAIKGGEFGGFKKGQVQGVFTNDNIIINRLLGCPSLTGVIGRYLNYAECHDNYTLFDKLVYSTLSEDDLKNDGSLAPKFKAAYDAIIADPDKLDMIKKQDKLAAAYLLLAQGTPFINGGQEFMRTKKGDPDSYSADLKGGITWTNEAGPYNIDDVNTINLSFKTTYSDVYNVYKGLIALRKANAEFTSGTASAKSVSNGFTKYTTGDFLVYFNATSADVTSDVTTDYTTLVDVTSGTPTESPTALPIKVPAKNFVILKK